MIVEKYVFCILLYYLGSTKCYGDLGCFGTGKPFFSVQRPLNILPLSPESINTKFRLYTRKNSKSEHLLTYGDVSTLHGSHFNPAHPTKMISHGFIENGRTSWMGKMKDEMLKHGDYNVINIDWGSGSLPPYTQATANTRVVGAVVARLIKYLQKELGAKPETFHLIGHSLGAHICGYAGDRTPHLGRITGLDPADPYFQYTDRTVRLDETDAQFVDIIHTDGISILKLGYGMIQPCGHVDYYPNGGETQPGCEKGPVSSILTDGLYNGVAQFVACNHLRSFEYFTESINAKCPFRGYQCTDYKQFRSGNCMPCQGKGCGVMGFHADKVKPHAGKTNVKYYLDTSSSGPYCRYHDQIQITFGSKLFSRTERGALYATIIGDKGRTGRVKLTDDNEIEAGKSYTYMVLSKVNIGAIKTVELGWTHNSKWYKVLDWNILGLRHPTVYVDKISVVNGEDSKFVAFCTQNTAMETGQKVSISRTC
ncbi:hypothetical protein LOTGIDRAFT_216931 [Lottia gigantea]|uniref:PLAT domain-containing protein n=1 Tax=Lottia gigantea TaxID=225164 RepID=V4A6S5_LOTGI|nr:hypothetical protein LOTGIDRAFT_216931 [Lottia gigantea]ESO92407.1 hypothetical protein LOTGIDRAFT_216931 [Lottia gigantea]